MTQAASINFSTYIEPYIDKEIGAKDLLDLLQGFLDILIQSSTCCKPRRLSDEEKKLFHPLYFPLVQSQSGISSDTILKIQRTADDLLELVTTSPFSDYIKKHLGKELSASELDEVLFNFLKMYPFYKSSEEDLDTPCSRDVILFQLLHLPLKSKEAEIPSITSFRILETKDGWLALERLYSYDS